MNKKKKTVLVIVAHPDDETIWMGGTLLQNKDKWNITIISLCRGDDKDRSPRFKKACEIFKAKYYMSDLGDETLIDIPTEEIIKRLKKFSNKKYDYIFTHGKNGEYGHKRHIDVNKAVRKMLKQGLLICKRVFFFSYIKKRSSCHNNKNADKFIYLTNLNFIEKKYLIKNIYGFGKNSFEERCCRNIETFNIKEHEVFGTLRLPS